MLGIVCLFALGCSCQVTLGEKKAYLHLNLPTNMFKDDLTLISSTILNASLLTGYLPKADGCNKPQIKKPNIQFYSLQLLFSCYPPNPHPLRDCACSQTGIKQTTNRQKTT